MDALLENSRKMIVQFDASDHKIYFNLDSGSVAGTLVVTKNNEGKTALHIYKDRISGSKRR